MHKVYINGSACISPQNTFEAEFPFEPIEKGTKKLLIEKPTYKKYISPIRLRRMKHVVKMGIAAANKAIKESGVEKPDAIICGTALGCMEDTEKFLSTMLSEGEELLNPTAFIQSTHNTVAGQIALINKCNGYNYTYVHRGFSYENALLDAFMMIQDGSAKNALAGGVEEATENYFITTNRLDYWKKEDAIQNLKLLDYDSKGTIIGEGAAFFMLSGEKTASSVAELKGLQMLYKPKEAKEIASSARTMLQNAGLEPSDIDLFICGLNGDNSLDHFYYDAAQELGINDIAYFKHLCGEYQTSSSFATWLATEILSTQSVPEYLMARGKAPDKSAKNILIYNHYLADDHNLILLSAV